MKIVLADSFTNADGRFTERLVMDIGGHDVQVIRCDGNNEVLAFVDQHAALVPINDVPRFIARWL